MIEFLLMLPLLIGLTVLLIRANSAIQVSIVDQQYSRAQTLFLAFNNSVYPEIGKREALAKVGANAFILGVSGNLAPEDSTTYVPEAPTQNITRGKAGSNDQAQQEPDQRANVRIRNTVALCAPSTYVKSNGKPVPIVTLASSAVLTEDVQFDYCGSPYNE